MAKTEFLQIRLTPEDRERIWHAAAADHLDASTWARRAILRAVEEWEGRQGQRQRGYLDMADDGADGEPVGHHFPDKPHAGS